jgi:DNA (cytosine-5)-methyltransferase 1
MKYLSVCSGIEAASVAWHPLGWQPVGFSEIEPFPSAVLAHHYPHVPNFGDMTKFQEWPLDAGAIDLLVGGTPCQSFSVAGLRQGLKDPRGNLMLTYLAIAARLRPRWIVWENVPGVLSSSGGRDFGSFLGGLRELGYQYAYRVLDAQWVRTQRHPHAVPQRRRRVFVVGCLVERGARNWDAAAKVLFERESVQRHIKKSGAAREEIAADAKGSVGTGFFTSHNVAPCLETTSNDYSRADGFTMVAQSIANTLGSRGVRSHTELDGHGAYIPVAIQGNLIGRDKGGPTGVGATADNVMYTMTKADVHGVAHAIPLDLRNSQPVPYDLFQITAPVNRQNRKPGDPCHTLARDNAAHAAVAQAMTVRRLTPRECERLQGFPDDYTLIPWRKKCAEDCPDGPRYRALGNSMAVNVMAWIGERIDNYERTGNAVRTEG